MTEPKTVQIGALAVSNAAPLTLIAGPCQLESRDHALMIAEALATACASAGCGLIFKSSYDKANRTSLSAKRGLGRDEGLAHPRRGPRPHRLPGPHRRPPPRRLRPGRASR